MNNIQGLERDLINTKTLNAFMKTLLLYKLFGEFKFGINIEYDKEMETIQKVQKDKIIKALTHKINDKHHDLDDDELKEHEEKQAKREKQLENMSNFVNTFDTNIDRGSNV